jgi:hypothetical protein
MYQTLKDLDLRPGDVVEPQYKLGHYYYTVNEAGLLCHGEPLFPLSSDYQKGGCYYTSGVSWKLISRAPRLQPWSQLPDKEKVELLVAQNKGKQLEVSRDNGVTWCEGTLWSGIDFLYYRVQPPPPRLPVVKEITQGWKTNVRGEFQPMSADHTQRATHKVTFTVTDGQPDCNSIKMEKLAT